MEVGSIVERLLAVKEAIIASKTFVNSLPFFARSFAEQDFAGGTGMGYDDWLKLLDKVIGKLQAPSLPTGEAARELASDCSKLSSHLERYADYLLTIPSKIRMASSFIQVDESVLKSAEEAPRFAEAVRGLKRDIDALVNELQARA
ncbi:MAG: hypothetical protein QXI84_09305 [Thermofilaceae archaeon]